MIKQDAKLHFAEFMLAVLASCGFTNAIWVLCNNPSYKNVEHGISCVAGGVSAIGVVIFVVTCFVTAFADKKLPDKAYTVFLIGFLGATYVSMWWGSFLLPVSPLKALLGILTALGTFGLVGGAVAFSVGKVFEE